MINRYPLWKYVLILLVTLAGVLYALPNLFGKDPAVVVSPLRNEAIDASTQDAVKQLLQQAGVDVTGSRVDEGQLELRFSDTDSQLRATRLLSDAPQLRGRFAVAQDLAPATPAWLRALNARPMYLGLDLQGGIHFQMEVDMDAAIDKELERYAGEIKSQLREKSIRHLGVRRQDDALQIRFRNAGEREAARESLAREFGGLTFVDQEQGGNPYLVATLTEQHKQETREFALQQNITTLRNRVNELGVAEPLIQRQGDKRIVVELPGVQDPAQAKDILGATATLEFRLVDERNANVANIAASGRVPPGTELLRERNGAPILLSRRVILTGDSITHAASTFDQRSGPVVTINLDNQGGRRFSDFTKDHVGERLAVVYIETKTETKVENGERVREKSVVREVISAPVIRDRLGQRFQIEGMDSPDEAHNLALLLRAGALAAPIEIVEERTVGPSLGRDNVEQGFQSVLVGFALVLVFMALYYRVFGLVANLALALNMVLLVALLSLLQATLTMPGIAGIVLTVGMAVDANVLIFERIREELRNGNTPQASIHAGYEKAFSTIADANVTTLIAAVVLYGIGTGPIKGFAVTLSLGILTSMFSAIMGTRALVNLMYGGKRLQKLPI